MIKGVIFDADGTLLKSMEFWDSMVIHLIESMGVVPSDNLTEILTPMSMLQGAEYIRNEYNLPISVEEIIEEENRIVKDFYLNRVELREGTVGLLEFLKEKNIPMTVASATDKALIEGALIHLDIHKYFVDVLSCTDIGEGKNSPKIYLSACELMNTKPCETVVAEDSLTALTTAKNAGFRMLALFDPTQQRSWEDLKKLGELCVEEAFDVGEFEKTFMRN